jgi:hypothetical protein
MTAAERRTTAALMTRSKASASTERLTGALRHPASLTALALPDWERLVREARRADLLSRIACLAEAQRVLDDIPAAPRAHLQSARVLAAAQHEEVRREVRHVAAALRPLEVPIVLLKGAAYVMAGRGAALGRLFSDIDILVPKERIAEVEGALMMRGWMTTHHSAYDQRYYREWMHELPPLQHIRRQTTLDVHHAILPLTARLQPDPAKLMAASVAIEGDGGALRVLAPCDMILHGMAHLLHNEDLSHGLRDLSDFDLLLREHGTEPGFWPALIARAVELQLSRPLYYGLRHARRLLGTPIPEDALAATRRAAPATPLKRLMHAAWSRGLASSLESKTRPATAGALALLYVRAHWLRMPPALLLRHVCIKALAKRQ